MIQMRQEAVTTAISGRWLRRVRVATRYPHNYNVLAGRGVHPKVRSPPAPETVWVVAVDIAALQSCFSRSHDAEPSNEGYSEPNGVNGVMAILAMAHASGLDVALQRSLARETDMASAARFQLRIMAWHRRR